MPRHAGRVRFLYKRIQAESGFDKTGKRDDIGTRVVVQAWSPILDFGLTDNLTIGIGFPRVSSNAARFDGSRFEKSQIYAENYADNRRSFSMNLVRQGLCVDVVDCDRRIDEGMALPVDVPVRLPGTNERVLVPKFMPVKEALRSLILNAAKQERGSTGWGDLEGALRWRLQNFSAERPVQAALTFSWRAPTGAFAAVPRAQRAIGAGVWEFGVGAGLDLRVREGLLLSASMGIEGSPFPSTRRLAGIADNRSLVTGACDAPNTGNNGDELCVPVPNPQRVEREGARQKLRVQGSAGLGTAHLLLRPFGLSAGMSFLRENQLRLGDELAPESSKTEIFAGASVDGLMWRTLIPLALDLEYSTPVAGRRQTLATGGLTATFKIYYRI